MAQTATQARARRRESAGHPQARARALEVAGRRHRNPRRVRRGAVIVAVSLMVGSPLAVVGVQAYLTQGQVRLARLQQQLNAQIGQHRDLELRVAQLEQPAYVLAQAQKQGLVSPSDVVDLPQVAQSPSQGAAPAESSGSISPSSQGSSSGKSQVAAPRPSAANSGGR